MSPSELCNGFFVSGLIHSQDWHAGALLSDQYYRFIKFFPDGWWLWTDRSTRDFDFKAWIASLDLALLRSTVLHSSPPTSQERDGGHLYELGSYEHRHDGVKMAIHSAIAQLGLELGMSFVGGGTDLFGFGTIFDPRG